ncbi:Sulfhydryl oxidase, partial [Monkeypox virus]|jgi:hypothetical protein
VSKV